MVLIFNKHFPFSSLKYYGFYFHAAEKINALSHVPIRSLCVLGGEKNCNSAVLYCIKSETWHLRCEFVSKKKQNLVSFCSLEEKISQKRNLFFKEIHTGFLKKN